MTELATISTPTTASKKLIGFSTSFLVKSSRNASAVNVELISLVLRGRHYKIRAKQFPWLGMSK